ncbi:MAG: polyphosphate polymerase domain-containing protein [Flavobacteriia bacterium]
MLNIQINEALKDFEPISLLEMDRVKLMNRVDTKFAFSVTEFLTFLPHLAEHYSILEIEGTRTPFYESLYLDDSQFTFFRDHHNGRTNRFKVRYRKYVESNLSFLEIKHKVKGRTDKSRIKVDDIPLDLLEKHTKFIEGIVTQDVNLKPVMWNSFHRMTLVNKTENERLTIDFDLTFKWNDKTQNFNNLIIAELKQENVNRNSAFYQLMKSRCIRPYRLSKYCIGSIELYGDSLKFNRFKKKLLQLKKINNYAA